MIWTVVTLNSTVDAEIEALPADMRARYVAAAGRRAVVVRVLVKKTEKTPRREIEIGLARARLVE